MSDLTENNQASPGEIVVLVAGGAHMDIVCTPYKNSSGIDKKGVIRYDFGGTGWNIATALAAKDAYVRLLTGLRTGGVSNLIVEGLKFFGIVPLVQWSDKVSSGGFCAMMDGPKLVQAVTDAPLEHIRIDDGLICAGMAEANACIVDANLSGDDIRRISETAAQRNVPVYFRTVSSGKADRCLSVHAPQAIFCHENDLDSVMTSLVGHGTISGMPSRSKNRAGTAWVAISKYLHCPLVVFKNNGGVILFQEHGPVTIVPGTGTTGHPSGNELGVIDSMAASAVLGLCRGLTLEQALKNAIPDYTTTKFNESAYSGIVDGGKKTIVPISMENIISGLYGSATRDDLTGVANRSAVMSELQRAINDSRKKHESLSVLFCDVDNLKLVNDTKGHKEGDKLLVAVAGILQSSVRQYTDTVGRMGGDEFVCVLPGTSEKTSGSVIERIRQEEAKACLNEKFGPLCGISVGVISWNGIESADDLVARADKAMYEEKQKRKRSCMNASVEGPT